MRAVNRTRDAVLGDRIAVADTRWARLRGLLGREGLDEGEGLWIRPSLGVHTFFMRFPVDVALLDEEGRVRVLYHALAPFRQTRLDPGADSALELPAGTLDATGTEVGDRIALVEADAPTEGTLDGDRTAEGAIVELRREAERLGREDATTLTDATLRTPGRSESEEELRQRCEALFYRWVERRRRAASDRMADARRRAEAALDRMEAAVGALERTERPGAADEGPLRAPFVHGRRLPAATAAALVVLFGATLFVLNASHPPSAWLEIGNGVLVAGALATTVWLLLTVRRGGPARKTHEGAWEAVLAASRQVRSALDDLADAHATEPCEGWRAVSAELVAVLRRYRASLARHASVDSRSVPSFSAPVELGLRPSERRLRGPSGASVEELERRRRTLERRAREARREKGGSSTARAAAEAS